MAQVTEKDPRNFWQAYVPAFLALLVNPITQKALFPGYHPDHVHLAVLFFDLYCFALTAVIYFSRPGFRVLYRTRAGFNLLLSAFFLVGVFLTNPLSPGHLQWLRVIFLLAGGIFVFRAFIIGVVKNEGLSRMLKNLGSALAGLVGILLLLEAVFMFVPKTIGSSRNLSSRLWFDWYWKPLNSQGFRDAEPAESSRKKVFFLGDSFTAGQGIEHPADRFPDLYQSRMGDQFQVQILADCGANSAMQLKYLMDYPLAPDALVLAWFVNDIEGAATAEGLDFQPQLSLFDQGVFQFIINRSYLLSFVYGTWPRTTDFGYGEFFARAWSKPYIVERHLAQLDQFAKYSQARRIPFQVILFPRLRDPKGSAPYLKVVRDHLQEMDIPTLDLTPVVESVPLPERVVSRYDDHPGPALHAQVAEKLVDWVSW
ncbi:MAG: SGNH/GDSL hydrolase family protein [Bacteroidia bacterium]|nr:SGNH/GDSL hydrolase family protein [Bacteroidia bacterium]